METRNKINELFPRPDLRDRGAGSSRAKELLQVRKTQDTRMQKIMVDAFRNYLDARQRKELHALIDLGRAREALTHLLMITQKWMTPDNQALRSLQRSVQGQLSQLR